MTYLRQLFMIVFASIVLTALQYQYWFGDNGRGDLKQLNKQISEQQHLNHEQQQANQVLAEDIKDLKNGVEAVEEHARVDLGLIKKGETFVQMSTADQVYSPDSSVTNIHSMTDLDTKTSSAPSAQDSLSNQPIYH